MVYSLFWTVIWYICAHLKTLPLLASGTQLLRLVYFSSERAMVFICHFYVNWFAKRKIIWQKFENNKQIHQSTVTNGLTYLLKCIQYFAHGKWCIPYILIAVYCIAAVTPTLHQPLHPVGCLVLSKAHAMPDDQMTWYRSCNCRNCVLLEVEF